MSKQKNKNEYGTFRLKSHFQFVHRKTAKILGLSFLILSVSLGIAFSLFKQDQKPQEVFQAPQVQAQELPGWWLKDYFGASICEQENCKPEADPDNDKLTNAQEFFYHSDPLNRDTNGNSLTDGEDVAYNFDPSKPGKVTFDEAVSQENILGESLVFNEDVKTILNETVDPGRITLPFVNELELKIINDNSKEAVAKYIKESTDVISKYFPKDREAFIKEALQSGDLDRINDIKIRAVRALIDLKKIETPSNALELHKYSLMFLDLLPAVISVPSPQDLDNEYSPAGNLWYDKTQAFFLVNQKMDLEVRRLSNSYQ